MYKTAISIFFNVIFLAFICGPTVIKLVDSSMDTSFFYSVTEEENKSEKTLKNFEIALDKDLNYQLAFTNEGLKDLKYSQVNSHSQFHPECISPPPETHIL